TGTEQERSLTVHERSGTEMNDIEMCINDRKRYMSDQAWHTTGRYQTNYNIESERSTTARKRSEMEHERSTTARKRSRIGHERSTTARKRSEMKHERSTTAWKRSEMEHERSATRNERSGTG